MGTTAVATQPESRSIVGFLTSDAARKRITPLLPKGVALERIAQEIHFAAKKNDDFLKATPESILRAVARGVQLDLIFGESLHLVRFGTECTLVVDYKGLAELAQRSGAARAVEADCVYEGDVFEFEKGLDAKLRHIPTSPTKRGKMLGAYCVIRRGGGVSTFDFMPMEDIEVIRKKSKSWSPDKVGPCPPWYAMKTVTRRTLKLVPKNPKLIIALAAADDLEEIPAGDFEVMEPTGPQLTAGPVADLPAAPRQGPYEEKASLDGSHVATPRGSQPARRAAPAEEGLHPVLQQKDPYTGKLPMDQGGAPASGLTADDDWPAEG
jgi:recombination protein RecT